MTTTAQGVSGGSWLAKLVVVALLALAVGLYLRIVIVEPAAPEPVAAAQISAQSTAGDGTLAAAQAVESESPVSEAPVSETPATEVQTAASEPLRDLPEDQLDLIRRVFAPEMGN